jgi:hypothetical protein
MKEKEAHTKRRRHGYAYGVAFIGFEFYNERNSFLSKSKHFFVVKGL